MFGIRTFTVHIKKREIASNPEIQVFKSRPCSQQGTCNKTFNRGIVTKLSIMALQQNVQSWHFEISLVTSMETKLLMQLQNKDSRAKPLTGCKQDRGGPSKDICSAMLF